MHSFFYNIYQRIASNKLVSFGLFLILILSLIFAASQIQFEEDITKLIPSNDKNSEAQKVLKTVNFADKIIVNISREKDATLNDLTKYATQFIDSINHSSAKYIKKIQGKVEDEDALNALDFVYDNLPLFLNDSDYDIIKQKIKKDSVDAITNSNYKTLISPTGFIAKETILKDPLGLSFIALKKLKQLGFGDDFTIHDGFLLSKDKNNILLFITPELESSETSENAVFADQLYTIKDELNAVFKDKVQSEYFGGVLIAVANAKQIKRDIQLTVGIAISILLIILILFYKRITIPIILFIPTVFGALLAVALLFIIRQNISAISLGIGSILLGVTLDYSLHILTHIRSNNNIKTLYKEITKPILMSGLTTALAFLCLLFLKSQALQDLGIFAAISVIGASVFALIFIPQVYKDVVKKDSKNTVIDRFAAFPLHKNKWMLILTILVFGLSLFTYNKVTFNNDLSKLNFEPPELKSAQLRLDALTNIASKSVYLAAYSKNEKEALQENDRIFTKLQLLKNEEQIIDFSSIGALVQSQKIQQDRIDKWASFWTEETIETTTQKLIESGNSLGFKPTSFQKFYTLLNSEFKPLNIEDFNAIKAISVDDYITTKNDFTTITTLVKVKDEHVDQLVDTFKDDSQILVIDRQQMNEMFLGGLKNDFNRLVGYSFIVVLLILLIFYRSLSLTLVSTIPIALTWLITIGIMGFFHIEFNIFNIIISTFIFGLGIDYSIFINNGLLNEYRTGESALPTHKTSIILSVVTTILGIGVLIFAKHPALYTISLVSIIGILSALLMSFTIQPLLFKLFIGSKTKRPITLRLLIHSTLSFGYYGIGGFILSMLSVTLMKIVPLSKKVKMAWFHRVLSKFMKSVLYSNPFISKKVINDTNETFEKQAIIIANHTSFLDILAMGMLHPKIIFLVNDWVYNSPIFGKAVQLAGFYPVSSGIEQGLTHLQKKVDQGYSLMAFPEGTRSNTNKMKRFHKGAFYLAEQLKLDIVPVLIHGNSEVLPKGSFIIKNGSGTLKILERIPFDDKRFGDSYKDRTKRISAHFKDTFDDYRNELEPETYFHNIILEDFRYKGDVRYKKVKHDLNVNGFNYKKIIDKVSKNATIIHLSKDCSQLDFLLSLDYPSRKIDSYIEDNTTRIIAKNSFISNNHTKINYIESYDDISKMNSNVLIINAISLDEIDIKNILGNSINQLILLNENRDLFNSTISELGFIKDFENESLLILKK